MRKINNTKQVDIAISHGGTPTQGLTQINITIPIDATKFLQGVNLINCIIPNCLPIITDKLSAITQQLDQNTIELLSGLMISGTAYNYLEPSPAITYLMTSDNALFGELSLNDGDNEITYT